VESIAELIARAPAFAGLETGQLELVAGCAHNEHVPAGALLLREGEPADTFYLLRTGLVVLELHAPGREPLRIQTLSGGEIVGWSWLFEPYRWQMDARALEDCRVVALDGACLRGKAEQDHELGYRLMRRFAASLVDRLQATRFQALDLYGGGGARG
jgi:CRP/FNR family cyclic AMP-dependent transcriptional regulator